MVLKERLQLGKPGGLLNPTPNFVCSWVSFLLPFFIHHYVCLSLADTHPKKPHDFSGTPNKMKGMG
jgi:hypothetical protein